LSKRLEYLAAQTGRSKAFYLRQMIENGLDDLEDYYLAADVLERGPQRGEKIHPGSQVRTDLCLGDCLHPNRQETADQVGQARGPADFWISMDERVAKQEDPRAPSARL